MGGVLEGPAVPPETLFISWESFPLHLPQIGLRDQPVPCQPAKTLSHFQAAAQQKVSWNCNQEGSSQVELAESQ